jgi:hypothetical protein
MRSFLFLFLFSLPYLSYSQKDIFISEEFEIFPLHTGVQGLEIVKVYSKGKSPKECFEKAQKIALQAIIFQGIKGSASVDPMFNYSDLNEYKKKYFISFFENDYIRFVSSADGGNISQGDFKRVGKLYRIGYILKIEKAELRKHLEFNNIIRKLGL